jgi:hypothetical protein
MKKRLSLKFDQLKSSLREKADKHRRNSSHHVDMVALAQQLREQDKVQKTRSEALHSAAADRELQAIKTIDLRVGDIILVRGSNAVSLSQSVTRLFSKESSAKKGSSSCVHV